jgi:hypothetical protein
MCITIPLQRFEEGGQRTFPFGADLSKFEGLALRQR